MGEEGTHEDELHRLGTSKEEQKINTMLGAIIGTMSQLRTRKKSILHALRTKVQ